MNYLAHAYLSFHQPGVLVGNMISDFVKGRTQYDYPPDVQSGIRLHREIDAFTDLHPVTKSVKQWLKPAAGAYAGAFMDVVYDHFLAGDRQIFPADTLEVFAKETYRMLQGQEQLLPQRFQLMLPYMTRQDWFSGYREKEGVARSFEGLTRRARYIKDAGPVFELFLEHYTAFKTAYESFFPDVKKMAELWLAEHRDK